MPVVLVGDHFWRQAIDIDFLVSAGVALRVGTTASVLVMSGIDGEETNSVPPAPRALE